MQGETALTTGMDLGQSMKRPALGCLHSRPEVAIALLGAEGGQQDVPEGEQMAHQVPLHSVDPLAVMTGLPHEVQQVIEPLLGLEGGLLRGDDHDEASGVQFYRGVATDVPPHGGLVFHCLSPQLDIREQNPEGAGGESRPFDFSSHATCPRDRPYSLAQTLTRCNAPSPFGLSWLRRAV